MDIDLNTLLVALMFVTILCMGIGNLLMSLADILNRASSSRRSGVHVSWMLLLLLVHFSLFWHTREILNVENWQFTGFLLIIAGPVLMFFATSVLLTNPSEEDERDLAAFLLRLGRPFFLMYAAIAIWVLLAGYSLSGGWVSQDVFSVIFLILSLVLAFSQSWKVQSAGAIVSWVLMGVLLVVRALASS